MKCRSYLFNYNHKQHKMLQQKILKNNKKQTIIGKKKAFLTMLYLYNYNHKQHKMLQQQILKINKKQTIIAKIKHS